MTHKKQAIDLAALVEEARAVVRAEGEAISGLVDRVDETAAQAMVLIYERINANAGGVLVVTGVGKSGLVGQRISASFASTGTASHFLHPVEALHGDLGRVRKQDLALILSYGGESDEITRLVDLLKRMGVPIVAITSRRSSTLGRLADLCIELGAVEEACPLKLAPTTSINCISAMADALVLGVMGLRSFSAEDFAAFHPAGSLGRKLLKVGQAMTFKVGEKFRAAHSDGLTVREVLAAEKSVGRRAGAVMLVDAGGKLSGIFTDGDLRRRVVQHAGLLDMPIKQVMTAKPKRIGAEKLASEAMAIMNQHRIDELPVVDGGEMPVGMIDVQDLVTLRIVD